MNEKNAETLLRRAKSMRGTAETMREIAAEKRGDDTISRFADTLADFLINVSNEIEGVFIE